ncbi:MAG: hypothetical protein O2816_13860 [Planctomycetota bacterium]|nr:hypothetical protein [Planctomycetota bacterium]
MRMLLMPLLMLSSALAGVAQAQESRIQGRVIDAEGGPRVGARVQLNWGHVRLKELTDAEGRFELLAQGDPDIDFASFHVERPPDAPITLLLDTEKILRDEVRDLGDLVLGPPGSLVVRVVDRAGTIQPSADVVLFLLEGDAPAVWRKLEIDPTTGEARLTGLAAGSYQLESDRVFDGVPITAHASVEIPAGAEQFAELRYESVLSPASPILVESGGFEVPLSVDTYQLRDATGGRSPRSWVHRHPLDERGPKAVRVPPGDHWLDLLHPHFRLERPVRIDRGRPVLLELAPRSGVQLDLSVPDLEAAGALTVVAHGPAEPGPVVVRDALSVDLTDVQNLAIPPGEWLLEVEVSPWPARWVLVTLEADRLHEVRLQLGEASPAAIPLISGPGRADPATATISLERGPDWFRSPKMEWPEVEAGHLELPGLFPEPYQLRFQWGPWAWIDYDFHGSVPPAVLTMPRFGDVRGEVLVSRGLAFDRLSIRLDAINASAPVLEDGTFVIPGLLAGRVAYRLLLDHSIVLLEGHFDLHGGTLTPVLDVREATQGPMAIDLSLDGEPMAGTILYLYSGRGGNRACTADETGRVLLNNLVPDSYDVSVELKDGDWSWWTRTRIQIIEGSNLTLPLGFTTVERTVEFRSADGRPVADATVGYQHGPSIHDIVYFRTDSDGRTTARIPEIELRFFRSRPNVGPSIKVNWTAGEGALVVTFPER